MNLPKNFSLKNTSRGFTLIELLIVIAIIGILAAVLIAVINPVAQMNKARDAGLSAALSKAGLAISSYASAYSTTTTPVYPDNTQFLNELTNVVQQATGGTSDWIMWSINGVNAPATCADTYGSGGFTGVGTRQCWFIYRDTTGCVAVKSFGDNTKYWKWTPNAGGVTLSGSSC
ncbi:MAG: type II secretion system protein [bacterium]|nr:type II secretion system protein [bacterium]